MVGEIGGNDYNYALFQGKSFEEIRSMTPMIIQAIKDAVIVSLWFEKTMIINLFSHQLV